MDTVSALAEGHREAVQTARERQEAARAAWRTSLAEGAPISGAALGRQFGLSERWGRARVAEARAEFHRTNSHAPGGDEAAHRGVAALEAAEAEHAAGPPPSAKRTAMAPPVQTTATPVIRRTTTLAVLAVASTAAAASYDHLRVLADLAGEGWRSLLLPISVDGLVVAASMSTLVRRRAGHPAGALAWSALALGLGASLVGNVVASDPTFVDPLLVKRVVAAWPPVALALAYELLMRQVRGASSDLAHQGPSGTG